MWSPDRRWYWNGQRWLTPEEKKAEDADKRMGWGIPTVLIGLLVGLPIVLFVAAILVAGFTGHRG